MLDQRLLELRRVLCGCLVVICGTVTVDKVAGETSRPNIVLVMADDLGFSDLGCYGGEIPTPNLDALANGGLRFRQFYNNAVCGPTRASLLTGLHCQRIGHSGTQWNDATQTSKCVTIGEVLQSAGYRTLMVGKWQERSLPARMGFDRFFGPMNQAKISYFHETKDNPFYLNEDRWPIPAERFYMTDAFTEHAVKFLDEALAPQADGIAPPPFFLYLAYIAPHWPLHAKETDIALHRQRYRELGWDAARAARFGRQRASGLIPDTWKLSPRPAAIGAWSADQYQEWQAERMAAYTAQVTSIDRGVGQVVESLRKAEALDNTLILFLSDNGAAPDGGLVPSTEGFGFGPKQDNRQWRIDGGEIRPGSGPELFPGPANTFAAYGLAWATVSNTPLRSTKLWAYEGGIRAPLIAHWPQGIRQRGGFSDQIGHVVDLMPTCIELAEAKYPNEFQDRHPLVLDGLSLTPAFRGEDRNEYPDLYWNAPKNQAMRSGDWKLVNAAPGQPWELYDLKQDGTETNNLAADLPDIVKELAARWTSWANRNGIKATR